MTDTTNPGPGADSASAQAAAEGAAKAAAAAKDTPATHMEADASGIRRGQAFDGVKAVLAATTPGSQQHNLALAFAKEHGFDLGYDPAVAAATAKAAADKAEADAAIALPDQSYDLTYMGSHLMAEPPEVLAKFNADITTGFAKLGVPQTYAQPLLDALLDTAKMYDPEMKPEIAKMQMLEQGAIIKKMAGSEDIVKYADIAEKALPPELKELLGSRNMLHSARSLVQLSFLGRVIAGRKAAK